MYVFVYGTLKKGYGNHRLLCNAEFIGCGVTMSDNYALYDLGSYPGMVRENGCGVRGEVYRVDAPTLKALDWLEGTPTLYKREEIVLDMEGDYILKAQTYIYQGSLRHYTKLNGVWPNGPESQTEAGCYGNCV